jgi:hypothetical protein
MRSRGASSYLARRRLLQNEWNARPGSARPGCADLMIAKMGLPKDSRSLIYLSILRSPQYTIELLCQP